MWRYVGASVPGSSHLARGVPCQDAHVIGSRPPRIAESFWAVVADGAGSARCSQLGAQLACDYLGRRISRWLSIHHGSSEPVDEQVIRGWIKDTRARLAQCAAREGHPLREYACTLSGIVVGPQQAICFQIGDGAIVVRDGQDQCQVVFWPEHGEYVNTTYFLTDETFDQTLAVQPLCAIPEAVALFTDGLQRLALHLASRSVHVPFFAPMWDRLAQEGPGQAVTLEPGLRRFLSSHAVDQRTDDDRTLVLATRVPRPD